MRAKFHGGPLDGEEHQVQDDQLEVIDQSLGSPIRYVRFLLDKRGVAHYSMPTGSPSGTDRK